MSKKKKDSNKKSNSKRSRSIVIVDDTLPISLVRSNVLTSVMNNEEIKNLIIYNKKGKEKLLEGLKDKTVCFKLHTSYELRDKNGAKVEPEIVNKDSGFASYKIKMKSFLNTIKADLIEKDYWTRTHYDENNDAEAKDLTIKAYHVVNVNSKAKEPEKLYAWGVTQAVGEVRNKKKKKVCLIRFDL